MKMTLLQHFAELRRRVIFCICVFIVSFIIGWIVEPYLETFLVDPLINIWKEGSFLYTGLTDGLTIQFSLATLIALLITIPVLEWQIWAYIAPGLHKNEKQFLIPIFVLSPILFLLGVSFAFYILFPFVFRFFITLNTDTNLPVVLLPAMKGYLTFVIGLLKVFGLAFQLPLILVLLNKIGVVSRQTIVKSRRYVIIGVFILSAVLTPPDILSQILLAIPMLLLFEISLLFMKKDC